MKIKNQLKKSLIIILISLIIFNCINIIFTKKEVQASTYNQYVKTGIDAFPESYKPYLRELQAMHPNWTFKAYYTGIKWDEVTSTSAENRCLANTIYKSILDPTALCYLGQMGDKNYYCASAKLVNYYVDPRNFLDESMVFQFLDLSYDSSISKAVIQETVKNSFLNGSVNVGGKTYSYVDIIMEAAQESKVSPMHIVVTIFQELGRGDSLGNGKYSTPAAVSGTVSGYTGLYNFFNYGATDGTTDGLTPTQKGLKKASEMKWTDPRTALKDGVKTVLANNYINAGQNTKYFYKFDVIGKNNTECFSHQYMTNIQDPSSQAGNLFTYYTNNGLINNKLNFIIPVYDNMPSTPAPMPTSLTSNDGELCYVNTANVLSLNLRQSPSTSATSLGKLSKNMVIAVVGTEGTWSKIKVYMATSYDANKSKSAKKWNNYELKTGYIPTEYVGRYNNNSVNRDEDIDFKLDKEGKILRVTPDVKLNHLKSEYNNSVLKQSDGANITNQEALLATGNKVIIDGVEYSVIKLGDVSNEGKIDAMDMYLIIQYLLKNQTFSDIDIKASDVNLDNTTDAMDMYQIIQFLLGNHKFEF